MTQIVNLLFIFIAYTSILVQHSSGSEVCLHSDNGSTRLTGFNSSYVGYVQVCQSGQWTDVIYEEKDEWSKKNTIVACRELGFQGSVRIFSLTESHISTPLTYLSVECTGLEEKLTECMWTAKNAESRTTNVLLLCKEDPYDGEVMVVGINGADKEGIVTLYNPLKTYKWSTLCTTDWDDTDADVACRQLGYSGGTSMSYRMDMVLDSKLLANKEVSEFKCSGSEGSLSECKHSTTSTYCSSEYAGVICATEPSEPSTSSLNLTTVLLFVSITITLLLIAILLLILHYTVKRFRPKPSSRPQPHRERQRSTRSTRTRTRIVRTQLDPEVPYAMTAPPSYADTLLADERVQERSNPRAEAEEEETNLISADTLSNQSSEQTHV